MAIVLDGALLDWTADDRLEPPAAVKLTLNSAPEAKPQTWWPVLVSASVLSQKVDVASIGCAELRAM